jgi:uncharacterized protein Veg
MKIARIKNDIKSMEGIEITLKEFRRSPFQ